MSKKKIIYQEFGHNNQEDNQNNNTVELEPHQQKLKIQVTKSGRKGKTVTIITGFQCYPETLTILVIQLKTKCGAGGTVKKDTIEIQGDRSQQLLEILTNIGYKAKII